MVGGCVLGAVDNNHRTHQRVNRICLKIKLKNRHKKKYSFDNLNCDYKTYRRNSYITRNREEPLSSVNGKGQLGYFYINR